MPEPHERLDEAMNQRRLELRLKWRDLAEAAGITYEALRAIRRGESRPTEFTARALDAVLRWAPGGVYAILDGGGPSPLQPVTGEGQAETPLAAEALSPSEALRRVVRSSARELGVSPEGFDEAMRLARQDLEEAAPPADATRTDLSDLLRARRTEAGLSLEAVAAATVDPRRGERLVEADWLDRLERAALDPSEHPEYPQLEALANVLDLDPGEVQEAAGAQFMDVHTVWSEDGQVRAVVTGELDAEDMAKVQNLMRLYRQAPRR
ncbi:helix-turn-helix transcriptional regulator [Streptomyces scabiei]|uniref:helix-turn-helix transcriptional regulator n=1 Tax=Streptomyces scabiei TaxID=1930 RepID=UPI0029BE2C60|nr:helix-turn-helix transcriptional regulator [Streptomyces scabiei]MDX3170070.1 helix-turn-helix transcriptional regulator [Streptomyces scabiei]